MSNIEQRAPHTEEKRAEEHLPHTDMRMDMPLGQNIRAIIPPSQMKTPGGEDEDDAGPYGHASQKPSLQNAMGMPHVGEVFIDDDASMLADERTRASDTLMGSTSADVHYGHGLPAKGQSSAEKHHDGKAHRKRDGNGAEQYGVQGGTLDRADRDGDMQEIK